MEPNFSILRLSMSNFKFLMKVLFLFSIDDPIRLSSFAFLENCRVHLNTWYSTLKTDYQLSGNEIKVLNGSESENDDVDFAMFNRKGDLKCYKTGTLTFYAEVPCNRHFPPHFTFTQEMCKQEVNLKNCTSFYSRLKNPEPVTEVECGIGTICLNDYTVEFAIPTECPVTLKTFRIRARMFYENDTFTSPTLSKVIQQIYEGEEIQVQEGEDPEYDFY